MYWLYCECIAYRETMIHLTVITKSTSLVSTKCYLIREQLIIRQLSFEIFHSNQIRSVCKCKETVANKFLESAQRYRQPVYDGRQVK